MDEIKTWAIVYEHPVTGERIKACEFAATKEEAMEKARKSNVRDKASGQFWKIVSAEVMAFH